MNGSASEESGPFAGLRVIDCATILAAPLTCQILGDFGASVIKIEHPTAPDGMRGHGPIIDGNGLWWSEIGRNKKTISVDLKSDSGSEVFLKLLAQADVLVENFRPGTLERWGYSWERLHQLNPKLIVLRVTGFGQEGPYASRPAFGTLIEAMSGFAHMTGEADGPPTLPAFGLADSIAGIAGVSAVAMALYHRDARGGTGQIIDLSLLEPLMMAVGPGPALYDKTGAVQTRSGNRSTNNAPRNLYRTSDEAWVAVSTSSSSIAHRVLEMVGHPEVLGEPWFQTGHGRAANAELLDRFVAEWISERGSDEVIAEFDRVGAAAALVYTAEDIVNDPQIRAMEMLKHVEDSNFGRVLHHNVLFRLSQTPGRIRFPGRAHGEDTEEVLGELGFSTGHIAGLKESGVVR